MISHSNTQVFKVPQKLQISPSKFFFSQNEPIPSTHAERKLMFSQNALITFPSYTHPKVDCFSQNAPIISRIISSFSGNKQWWFWSEKVLIKAQNPSWLFYFSKRDYIIENFSTFLADNQSSFCFLKVLKNAPVSASIWSKSPIFVVNFRSSFAINWNDNKN